MCMSGGLIKFRARVLKICLVSTAVKVALNPPDRMLQERTHLAGLQVSKAGKDPGELARYRPSIRMLDLSSPPGERGRSANTPFATATAYVALSQNDASDPPGPRKLTVGLPPGA